MALNDTPGDGLTARPGAPRQEVGTLVGVLDGGATVGATGDVGEAVGVDVVGVGVAAFPVAPGDALGAPGWGTVAQ